MRNILVACVSEETAERGIRVAADLSVVSGASLAVAYVPQPARVIRATADLDAAGYLSDILFARGDWKDPTPAFSSWESESWLDAMRDRLEVCEDTGDFAALETLVRLRRPDLVVTCDSALARTLVEKTTAPVWRVRSKHRHQSWLPVRTFKCAIRGSRALAWAQAFAAGVGAKIETTYGGRFRMDAADLVVMERESQGSLLSTRTTPVVVV